MTDLLDKAPCCYFSFNDAGELLCINQTLCATLGYTREELMNQKVEIIFPVSTKIFYQTHFFPLLKMHGHAEEIFIFLLAKNGTQLPVLMNAVKRADDKTLHYDCACIVVPNRKKFEDELVIAKKVAEQALFENSELKKVQQELISQTEKLDAQVQLANNQNNKLKQFNGIATHDLQEPLRKILFLANLLKDEAYTGNPILEQLGKLYKEASVMSETLSGLQQYIWLQETTLQPVNVNCKELLQDIKIQLAIEFEEDQLELFTGDLPGINADYEQIKLLFYQVLNNAILYKKPGEKAIVSITTTVLKKNIFKEVEGMYKYQDILKININDEGLGFDPQYKIHIFEMFKKLHHLKRRGIGLALCKLIVENHHGSIEADSKPGKGTTITILFPGEMLVNSI